MTRTIYGRIARANAALALLFCCFAPVSAYAQGAATDQYQKFSEMINNVASTTCTSRYWMKRGISLDTKYELLKILSRTHRSNSIAIRSKIADTILMKAYQGCPRLFAEDPANWKDR